MRGNRFIEEEPTQADPGGADAQDSDVEGGPGDKNGYREFNVLLIPPVGRCRE